MAYESSDSTAVWLTSHHTCLAKIPNCAHPWYVNFCPFWEVILPVNIYQIAHMILGFVMTTSTLPWSSLLNICDCSCSCCISFYSFWRIILLTNVYHMTYVMLYSVLVWTTLPCKQPTKNMRLGLPPEYWVFSLSGGYFLNWFLAGNTFFIGFNTLLTAVALQCTNKKSSISHDQVLSGFITVGKLLL